MTHISAPHKYSILAHRLSNRYDGFIKKWTKQCEECPEHLILDEGEHACFVGVAWKKLVITDKPRRCAYFFRINKKKAIDIQGEKVKEAEG